MGREGRSSLFRRLRAEASAPRKLGEALREAEARLDRLVAEPHALTELAAAGLGPLAEPVTVPPALEARLARCLGDGGGAGAVARPIAERRPPSMERLEQRRSPAERPDLLRTGRNTGDARTGAAKAPPRSGAGVPADRPAGFEGGKHPRRGPAPRRDPEFLKAVGARAQPRAVYADDALEAAPRSTAEHPATPPPGEVVGRSRPVLVGRASAEVTEMLARYALEPSPPATGGAPGLSGSRAAGPERASGRARGDSAELDPERRPDRRSREAGGARGDGTRGRAKVEPLMVGDAPTRFAAPPRDESSPGARSGRGSRGSAHAEPEPPKAPATSWHVDEDDAATPATPPVGTGGPTGLRALAALRDGPLDDVRPEGPGGLRSPLETPADRDLPPLLRERAREKELAHVLGRALRAEAARHGIEVDRS